MADPKRNIYFSDIISKDSVVPEKAGKEKGETHKLPKSKIDFIADFKAKALLELGNEENSDKENTQFEDMYLDTRQKYLLKNTRCLIRGHGKWKLRWDLIIMLLAIFNWFTVPLEVSFEPRFMKTVPFSIVNYIIDIGFMADLIINFRTTFIHSKTGNEVVSTKYIAIAYLKGRFWIDFLATIPFDSVGDLFFGSGNTELLRSISLLKLVRVLRLNKIISILKVANEVKLSLKLIKLIFFLIMYLHWCACAWYFLTELDDDWLPPLDYVYVKTEFYEKGIDFQYSSSLYHSVLILTGNDIGPRGIAQLTFCSSAVTLGAIINANIFGELAVILATMNRNAALFQVKLDTANAAMKNLSIPEKLQVQVTGFLTYSKALLESQEELEAFLQMISPSLRQKVLKHIFYDILLNNSVLCRNDYLIDFLIKRLNTHIFLPEFSVVTQGEHGNQMYFISKGECEVTVTDHKGMKNFPPKLRSGDLFGEVALLLNCNRTATVKTEIYSLIASLKKNDFDTVCRLFYVFYTKLKEKIKSYKDSYKMFVKELLRSVDYMSKLSEDTIEEISYYLKQVDYEKDKVIFRAGDPIDKIYFITNGRIITSANINDTEVPIDSLYRGCSVGSNGIVGNFNYNFSGKAETKLTVLVLSKEDLKALVNSCDDLDKQVFELKEYFYEHSIPFSDFRIFREPEGWVRSQDIARLAINRLLRISKNLNKYLLRADQIIDLLVALQKKYNPEVIDQKHGNEWAKTAELVKELFAYIKRDKNNHNSSQTDNNNTRSIGIQVDQKSILGILKAEETKLPSIFSPSRLSRGQPTFKELDILNFSSENDSNL
jgi:CRP-like cAMP-binding protein